jgi:hypothetical protein
MAVQWIGVRCAFLMAALGTVAGLNAVTGFYTSTAIAAEDKQGVRDILFDTPQLDKVDAGSELTYNFNRSVSEAKLLGPDFSDKIKLSVLKAGEDGRRDVSIAIFTGDRGRDARNIEGLTANPVLVFYLDRAVANLTTLAGGSKGYLKNRFRLALRTTAKIDPVKIEYNGKSVDGHHVWVTPYINDPNKEKMSGYEGARFDFYVSDDVPGYLVELTAHFESSQAGAPKLDERIVLEGAGVVK